MSALSRFQIKGLHGRINLDMRLRDNTLVIVGENGAGKTTALRILFHALSGQWRALARSNFAELRLTIDDEVHRIRKSDLASLTPDVDMRALAHFPPHVRNRFRHALNQGFSIEEDAELEFLCERYGVPIDAVYELAQAKAKPATKKEKEAIQRTLSSIDDAFGCQVLYLPTYRRIEQELSFIYKGLDESELRHRRQRMAHAVQNQPRAYVELVEFGMTDVKEDIDRTVDEMNRFARETLNNLTFGYLGDIVEKQYEKVNVDAIARAPDDLIQKVLNRIQGHILTAENKHHLRAIIAKVRSAGAAEAHEQIVCHYFSKLMGYQEQLEGLEARIVGFCNVCNEYMVDKQFSYDTNKYQLTITRRDAKSGEDDIHLQKLSSGEKQIVSLFSHLYLSGKESYFVLIDEPELSLSVPWQRRFLKDIRDGGFCEGLVAVTHSPFIYDNELKPYARSLGEFIS